MKLTKPKSNFLTHTTLGILPEHVWKKVRDDSFSVYNGPGAFIGSGKFEIESVNTTFDDRPTKIQLMPFVSEDGQNPFIDGISFSFFGDFEKLIQAYQRGKINAMSGVSPLDIAYLTNTAGVEGDLYTGKTTRIFGAFFNTLDGRLLSNAFLRAVLDKHINRKRIIDGIFLGHASAVYGPHSSDTIPNERDLSLEEIKQTLDDIGWLSNEETGVREKEGTSLSLTFLIPDIEEFRNIGDIIRTQWEEIGASVQVTEIPSKDFSSYVKGGEFDAVLYGYEADTKETLINFWHSTSPESFVAYLNFGDEEINNLLERFIQEDSNTPEQEKIYKEFKERVEALVPAVFLYSPHFSYIVNKDVQGIGDEGDLGVLFAPSDRFNTISNWYTQKDRVWKIFAPKHTQIDNN